ncbi:MAG: putative conserved protein, DUF1501 family [Chloroflexi bacterium AL-W]|nr:putative conserved protein, DUF1501 family [Chloroflexi bacterium AL-N1]NOK68701.1 putative conserved protein, DUF1501 family [Chloroflexi bacterium AL-N10]NOK76187.1 putative conserved protein, DUF1501 family [Chloroflexi bacterium AL-N5]NOK84176.1 putative conserved protein, DUF1501 family [Chloroflexi bacterium AL-W]NOK91325.1 putative conserved protein, DUF1501 family [Chloroflexi bacterium AL-N15]
MVRTRRNLLRFTTTNLLASALPRWMPRMAFAPKHTAPRGDVLVCIFLRGAADGLNIVVPHGEDEYYRLRPGIGIPRPDDRGTQGHLRTQDLDGFFGIHPSLTPLMPFWEGQELAFVQACGAPDESRSHFQAMELMERGISTENGPASGWIGRHLASLDTNNTSPLRAIGVGERIPRSLQGRIPAAALRSITDFHMDGDAQSIAQMQSALVTLYADGPLIDTGQATLDVLATLESLDPERYRPATGVQYPDDEFGQGLRQVAMLIKAEVGLEVACLDVGDWDTHIAQGGNEGWMAGSLASLAQGMAAFYADIHEYGDQTLVITMSEFGRRVRENGGLGTDHGHGSMMMLLGGGVNGGRVHGDWPGLAADQLVGPGDLAATSDYRDILGEILQKRLNNPQLDEVFPGYAPTFRGVAE